MKNREIAIKALFKGVSQGSFRAAAGNVLEHVNNEEAWFHTGDGSDQPNSLAVASAMSGIYLFLQTLFLETDALLEPGNCTAEEYLTASKRS
jgi:hypothetical protein